LDDKNSLSSKQDVISIEQVREMQKKIALSPFEGKYRVIIFSQAENLTLEASNCLLKTLEDPPDGVVIVLLAANMGNLLSTVVSRCLLVQFKPVSINLIKDYLLNNFSINEEKAFEISRVSQGCPGWAVSAVEDTEVIEGFNNIIEKIDMVTKGDLELRFEYADDTANSFKKEKKPVKDELYLWLNYWRDILLTKIGAVDLVIHNSRSDSFKLVSGQMSVDAIFRVIKMLMDTLNLLDKNVNANLAIEQFVISLPTVNSETN
jgi:DNA polymerase-3 subunit delta'